VTTCVTRTVKYQVQIMLGDAVINLQMVITLTDKRAVCLCHNTRGPPSVRIRSVDASLQTIELAFILVSPVICRSFYITFTLFTPKHVTAKETISRYSMASCLQFTQAPVWGPCLSSRRRCVCAHAQLASKPINGKPGNGAFITSSQPVQPAPSAAGVPRVQVFRDIEGDDFRQGFAALPMCLSSCPLLS
jgi:hypothetical protein